ncbi:hypothetical protein QZH41_008642 [Actinostola sp. cb2023]|nr:hypothetical protein QZH41_008642 [Actinostola sp. cb2023]
MDLTPALASLVWILSCYSIQTKCDNLDVIQYSAANTSLVHNTKTRLNLANFVIELQNKYLSFTPIKVLQLKKKEACLLRCIADLNCGSLNVVNWFPDSNGKYKCELLNTTVHNVPSKQTSNDNFHHFAIQTKCLSKPCKNNGFCIPVSTNDTYTCKCPQNFIGDHCEMVAGM